MSEKADESFTLEPEQQTAARTLDRNITVEAGAGTGKTTTLTERYLTILRAHLDGPETLAASVEEGEREYRLPADIKQITDPETARRLPEQIVVTTFTERAAEDLKQSIRTGIRDRLEEIDDRQQWELWRAAADGIEASYIHTIHGFCSRLLEEYATVHSETDPKFDVLEEEDAQILIRRFATELIKKNRRKYRHLHPCLIGANSSTFSPDSSPSEEWPPIGSSILKISTTRSNTSHSSSSCTPSSRTHSSY